MKKMSRRKLLRYYLPLGILSFLAVLFRQESGKEEPELRKARYYKNLAG